MHFVAALDGVPAMRAVLTLFEGVATGAADGYARMAGGPRPRCCTSARAWATASPTCTTPAGPGSGIVDVVGDHATGHQPLRRAAAVRHRRRRGLGVGLAAHQRRARRRGSPTPPTPWPRPGAGRVATLVLPADASWAEGGEGRRPRLRCPPGPRADPAALRAAADALRSGEPARAAPRRRRRAGPTASPPRAGSRPPPGRGCSPRRSRPGWSAGRASPAVGPAGLRRRAWPQHQLARRAAPGAARRPVPGRVLRLPRQARRPRARRLPRCTPWRRRSAQAAAAAVELADLVAAGHDARLAPRRAARAAHRRR